jgi:molybdopterin-binding protein
MSSEDTGLRSSFSQKRRYSFFEHRSICNLKDFLNFENSHDIVPITLKDIVDRVGADCRTMAEVIGTLNFYWRNIMKISARNCIEGKVVALKEGPVTTEVTIETPAGEKIVSTITTGSAKTLGLKVGGKAYAVIKASNVMVAVD